MPFHWDTFSPQSCVVPGLPSLRIPYHLSRNTISPFDLHSHLCLSSSVRLCVMAQLSSAPDQQASAKTVERLESDRSQTFWNSLEAMQEQRAASRREKIFLQNQLIPQVGKNPRSPESRPELTCEQSEMTKSWSVSAESASWWLSRPLTRIK